MKTRPATNAVRRTPAPRTRRPVEERRQQILELGMKAFTTRPFEEVSIEEIATSAGISRGLIFHYFPTKHEFFVAVLEAAAAQLASEVLAVSSVEGPPSQRLVRGLDAYFKFVEAHADTYATLLRSGVGRDALVMRIIDDTRKRIVAAVQKDLRMLGGEKKITRAALIGWIGFVEAVALDWCDHRDLPRKKLIDLCARALDVALPGALVD